MNYYFLLKFFVSMGKKNFQNNCDEVAEISLCYAQKAIGSKIRLRQNFPQEKELMQKEIFTRVYRRQNN